MKIEEFNFVLPSEKIARFPAKQREESKLMVINRSTKKISHHLFKDIKELIEENDFLVVNNSSVLPGKLFGRVNGKKIEVTIVKIIDTNTVEALTKPAKHLGLNQIVEFGDKITALVVESLARGRRRLKFTSKVDEVLKKGYAPLPPYIKRKEEEARNYKKLDLERYQTVYSKTGHSVAAPTAGLHFSRDLMEDIKKKNSVMEVKLNVGEATFQMINEERIENHRMGKEEIYISESIQNKIMEYKQNSHKLIAVGTTSVRSLETFALLKKKREKFESEIFIYPGFQFRMVDKLITNFHLPQSSLFILVCAFAGIDLMHEAYRIAIEKNYKFFSYGDAMFIC